jgi:hypothetical protein
VPDALAPSPSRTRVSIDFSKLPPSPLRTAMFLFSSLNPISRSFAIFESNSSGPSEPTDAPKILDCLFLRGDGGSSLAASASRRDFEDNGKIDDADLNPNLLPVFGGRGGGWSSEFVLPVLLRIGAFTVLS